MSNAIEVKNLTKRYSDFCLSGVDLVLPEGAIMGLVGENGAGKSTTIKALLGLIRPDEGQVKLLGKDPALTKGEIGVVFDADCFPETLTADGVERVLRKIHPAWDTPLYWQYCKQFGLPKEKAVKEYSRGMKMKLSIAAALAHHPKLLILDEATSGLDPVVRSQVLDLFLEFIQQEDHSILMSSHITGDLERICDYITFLHKGKVAFSMEKDRVGETYGVVPCGKEEAAGLAQEAIACRENMFGCELLVQSPAAFQAKHPALSVQKASIEQIMLFYAEEEGE